MDNPLGHEAALNLEEIDYAADDSAIEAPPEIGNDERRLHVRAYNHWASLLKDRSFPSIEDLEPADIERSEEHTSELQSLMRISYAVFCLKKKKIQLHKHADLINYKYKLRIFIP